MLNLLKYLLFITLSTFFYSCGSEYSNVNKIDNKLFFYSTNNQLKKEIILNNANQIVGVNTFNDGKLHSKWISKTLVLQDSIEYYGNGKIKTRGYLKDGEKHSLWSYFDRDGHLLIERYFSYGKPTNIWIWYNHHNHGHIENFEIYEHYRDDGQFFRFYQSGKVKEVKNYLNNKLDGLYTLFNNDTNNSIQFATRYHLGKEITY